MALKSGCAWLVGMAWLFGACSSGAPSSEESSISSQGSSVSSPGTSISARMRATGSQTITASLNLPSGLTSAGLLVAQNNVQLDSNISVPGPVWSGGALYLQPDVAVPAATVTTGNVVLTDRDTITSLTYGGTLTRGNGDSIGSSTHAALTNAARSTSVTFPAASLSYTLSTGQTMSLSPGSYVSVTVLANSGATLTLGPGDYYFGSLDLQSSAVLKLNPTQGATRIFVASGLTWRPTFASGADPSRLFVEYLGTNPIILETPFWGTILAPRTLLTLGTANSQPDRGSFSGQSLEVQPNAKLEFVAFNPAGTTSSCVAGTWDPDGNPFTPCVTKTTCTPGSRVSSEGTTTSDRTCAACASGTFSKVNNAPSCSVWTTCQAGSYVSNTPSATVDRVCVACPAGQYSSGNNQSQCLPQGSCAAGTVQTAAGTSSSATACTACVAGQYCAGGASPQTTCVAGTWDNDSNAATVCVAKTSCLAGTYVANEGTTTTDWTCAGCASGSFSVASNAASCTTWTTCPLDHGGPVVRGLPSRRVLGQQQPDLVPTPGNLRRWHGAGRFRDVDLRRGLQRLRGRAVLRRWHRDAGRVRGRHLGQRPEPGHRVCQPDHLPGRYVRVVGGQRNQRSSVRGLRE